MTEFVLPKVKLKQMGYNVDKFYDKMEALEIYLKRRAVAYTQVNGMMRYRDSIELTIALAEFVGGAFGDMVSITISPDFYDHPKTDFPW